MLTLNDRSLFIDSTDSDATDASERLNIEVSAPITTEHELNKLYLGMRSFSFTNLIYNVQASDYLTFYVIYEYKDKTPFAVRQEVYIDEGQYTGQQFADQWSLQQVTPGDPLNTTEIDTKNYTVINPLNMGILPNLNFNARTGKLSFSWGDDDITSYEIPTSQISDDVNYPYPPIPSKVFLPINSATRYLAIRMGLYKDTDTLFETQFVGNEGILIPLSWTETLVGLNTKFQLDLIYSPMSHLFREQSIQFIDINCDQIAGFHFASKTNNLYPEGIIARVPILAGFNQSQNSYYDELNWCPISQNNISGLQFTLSNPYTSAAIFRSPIQFEIVIHEEKVSIAELTETTADQQRFMLPLTNEGDRTTDNLDISHQYQNEIQRSINSSSYLNPSSAAVERLFSSNKRTRYPSFM
jgi:hypothetical protein